MSRIVKKPAERRAEIVQAARYLFTTKDYNKTTMEDVIKHLSIAKGTVYHYFKSKEDLLTAVVNTIVDEAIANLQTTLAKSHGNAIQKLNALVSGLNMSEAHPQLLAEIHRSENSQLHLQLMIGTLNQCAPLLASVIEQGCVEGIFQCSDPLTTAEFILAGTQFLTDRGIHPWSNDEFERRAHGLGRIIEQVLGAPPQSCSFLNAALFAH